MSFYPHSANFSPNTSLLANHHHKEQHMKALVYEGPYQMVIRDVPIPAVQHDEVLIHVAYSGICGSELSGFEGKNALRKPPLIMGHEFTGTVEALGDSAKTSFPDLSPGMPVTVNPLISCGECAYCRNQRPQLCPNRKLLSASLPGSNAEYLTVRADAVYPLPDGMTLPIGSLTEPAACAVHAASLVEPAENALVVGAGPIGLLVIEALQQRGFKTIYCADLNTERLSMAESLSAQPVTLDDHFREQVAVSFDAVGATATRQASLAATRAGGYVVWIGLHERFSELDVNDAIRREITCHGAFAYNQADFRQALDLLHHGHLRLDSAWTRIEPLENGASCFEELLRGSSVAKIWLTPG
jgi:threonine dehydrogenase-like Zn-dependent dehydrogenase